MSDPTDSTTTAPKKVSESGISDKDYLDALSKVYAEAMEQSRHQEAMRSVVSGFIITLTAASVGALGFFFRDGRYPTALALAVAAFVVLLGLFGAVFVVRTEYMRWQLKEPCRIDTPAALALEQIVMDPTKGEPIK